MEVPSLTLAKRAEKSFDMSRIMLFGPAVVAILASVVIGVLVVWPKYSEMRRLSESNKTLAETAVKLENKAATLSKMDREELRVQLAAAELLLPSNKSIFTFIRQIEDVRSASGVIITNLSVGSVGKFSSKDSAGSAGADDGAGAAGAPVPPPPGAAGGGQSPNLGDVKSVTMNVSVTSDFDQIFRFLNEVYSLPRVTTVSGLAFTIDRSGLIATTMEINSLWQDRPAQLASVEAPLPELSGGELALLKKVESEGVVGTPVEIPDVPRGKANIFSAN